MHDLSLSLLEQMNITEHELDRRKGLMDITEEDEVLLKACEEWLLPLIPTVVQQFYAHQIKIPEVALTIADKQTLGGLHNAMKKYVADIFCGNYNQKYAEQRIKIGKVHQRMGVSPKFYLASVQQIHSLLNQEINKHFAQCGRSPISTLAALQKVIYFDNQFIFDTYISSKNHEVDNANKQLLQYASSIERRIKKRTRELEELSMRDSLTGLYNQRALLEELKKLWALSFRSEQHFTLLYIDLNRFKQVNDNLGHLAGNQVLIDFATACQKTLRQSETAARYGGDEFIILLPNTSIDCANVVGQRLIDDFTQRVQHDVGLSIGGVSYYPDSGLKAEDILSLADKHMYSAKAEAHRTNLSAMSFEARWDACQITHIA